MVVFTAIFTVTIIAFISVLVSITRTQVRQTAVAEVNQESQFLLQSIQYFVERSSLIEAPANSATTTVKLRLPTDSGANSQDPTTIFASGTAVYAQSANAAVIPLTSDKVIVSNFTLTKYSNPPGKDSLAVNFTMSYNTSNPQQQFAQSLEFAVARVNAATFDSGVFPSIGASSYKLGSSTSTWQSVNDVLYFNGSNVGVGVTPNTLFQVHGGDMYVDSAGSGLILKSAGGSCYRVTVSNGGAIATTSLACP